MKPALYEIEAAVEETHWWFGRRKLFARELLRAGVSKEARVLDVGTSTGGNLRMLRELEVLYDATGLDPSEDAVRLCKMKGIASRCEGRRSRVAFPRREHGFRTGNGRHRACR